MPVLVRHIAEPGFVVLTLGVGVVKAQSRHKAQVVHLHVTGALLTADDLIEIGAVEGLHGRLPALEEVLPRLGSLIENIGHRIAHLLLRLLGCLDGLPQLDYPVDVVLLGVGVPKHVLVPGHVLGHDG